MEGEIKMTKNQMKKLDKIEEFIYDWLPVDVMEKEAVEEACKEFKALIRQELEKRDHDHEILVNTILETKKEELIRMLESLRMEEMSGNWMFGPVDEEEGNNIEGYNQAVQEQNKRIDKWIKEIK